MDEYMNDEQFAAAQRQAERAAGFRKTEVPHVQYGDNRHHAAFTRAKSDELLFLAGILRRDQLSPDAAPDEFMNALRLARDYIALSGSRPPAISETAQIMQRAFLASDFPFLLENVASRALTAGYDNAGETWPLIVRQTTTLDFRKFSRVTKAELPPPPLVGEAGELTIAQLGDESAETASASAFAVLMPFSRKATVNNDLTPEIVRFAEAGRSISRGIGDAVYAILTGNPTLASDNVALFHADHGNYVASRAGAAPSVTTLDAANTAMMGQQGPSGETLNIRPAVIVGAPALTSVLSTLRGAVISPSPSPSARSARS